MYMYVHVTIIICTCSIYMYKSVSNVHYTCIYTYMYVLYLRILHTCTCMCVHAYTCTCTKHCSPSESVLLTVCVHTRICTCIYMYYNNVQCTMYLPPQDGDGDTALHYCAQLWVKLHVLMYLLWYTCIIIHVHIMCAFMQVSCILFAAF